MSDRSNAGCNIFLRFGRTRQWREAIQFRFVAMLSSYIGTAGVFRRAMGAWQGECEEGKKGGRVTTDLIAFLTTEPDAEVKAIHPKVMPAILTSHDEVELWFAAPWEEAASKRTGRNRAIGCQSQKTPFTGSCRNERCNRLHQTGLPIPS